MAMQWLNTNSAAIQAISTVVLVLVTSWYALRAHQLTSLTNEQLKLLRKSQAPDIGVSFCGALVPMGDGQIVDVFSVSAANKGLLSVTVDSPFIQLPDRRTMVFPGGYFHSDSIFPCRLEPGEGCSVLITVAELTSGLNKAGYSGRIKIRGAYRDKIGTMYLSEPFEATC
ncbi:hypothetical protein [Geomonas limicola]|uniref:hypothetical protein n=1 Tax=Geomonas limicola TaxID=2740186 RepID=UPI001607B205|nr:hypothetical protein [Geomonas limicola]